jgi:hypothetical protein
MKNATMEELEKLIRDDICGICDELGADGKCSELAQGECSLFHLFPLVAQTIQETTSDDINVYLRAIREKVCTICLSEPPGAGCVKRIEARCALDSYLPLIVDVIERTSGKAFERSVL